MITLDKAMAGANVAEQGTQEQEQVHAEERTRCPTEQEAPAAVQAVILEN